MIQQFQSEARTEDDHFQSLISQQAPSAEKDDPSSDDDHLKNLDED